MRTKQELYQAALRTVALRRQTARANAEDARLEAEAAIPALRHAEDEVRVRGIRCALCSDPLSAEMTRRHNDANMLAIGAGFTGKNLAERMVEVFLSTDFEGGRHERRVNKLNAIQP